jgi:multiple sugar transport system substrate-binding protein
MRNELSSAMGHSASKDVPEKLKAGEHFTRRELLKMGSLAGLGLATLGGLPRQANGQAPAVIRGTRLSILQGTYFIAPAQDLFRKQAEEWGKANGVTVTVDFLNWPDLQPKIAAAMHAGGIDVVEMWPGWNYLYKDNLVDVTDIAEDVGRKGGGYEEYILHSALVDGRYLSVPHTGQGGTMNYRISWFKEVGVANAEDAMKLDFTWDEYHAVGKKLKAKGKPFGQALGHSPGDPRDFCYAYMWSHGAMEVDKDGKTVRLDTPAFVEGMKRFIQAWKDCYDETGTSWDDSSNNRAFLSEQISCTQNGSSIYFAAKKDKPDLANDMNHMPIPRGPSGRFYYVGARTMGILKNSKNIAAGKQFLTWWFDDEQFAPWFRLHEGYNLQHTKKYGQDPMWNTVPKLAAYREIPKYGRDLGYAGPPNEKAALAYSKYIVVDTLAKAVQSGDAGGSIKWGVEQLQRIYGG